MPRARLGHAGPDLADPQAAAIGAVLQPDAEAAAGIRRDTSSQIVGYSPFPAACGPDLARLHAAPGRGWLAGDPTAGWAGHGGRRSFKR